jgi:hypothetical protein
MVMFIPPERQGSAVSAAPSQSVLFYAPFLSDASAELQNDSDLSELFPPCAGMGMYRPGPGNSGSTAGPPAFLFYAPWMSGPASPREDDDGPDQPPETTPPRSPSFPSLSPEFRRPPPLAPLPTIPSGQRSKTLAMSAFDAPFLAGSCPDLRQDESDDEEGVFRTPRRGGKSSIAGARSAPLPSNGDWRSPDFRRPAPLAPISDAPATRLPIGDRATSTFPTLCCPVASPEPRRKTLQPTPLPTSPEATVRSLSASMEFSLLGLPISPSPPHGPAPPPRLRGPLVVRQFFNQLAGLKPKGSGSPSSVSLPLDPECFSDPAP